MTKICPSYVFYVRQYAFLEDADKRLIPIHLFVYVEDRCCICFFGQPCINGREYAPVNRQQMRGEIDPDLFTGGNREFLLNLRGMSVRPKAIGLKPFIDFAK